MNHSPHDSTRRPRDWTDSGHWRLLYSGWTLADLVSELNLNDRFCQNFGPANRTRPGVRPLQSLQYLALSHLRSRKLGEPEFMAVGQAMRNSRTLPGWSAFYDRCVFVFSDGWTRYLENLHGQPVPPELARMAAEAFHEQCLRKNAYPDPLFTAWPVRPWPAWISAIFSIVGRWGRQEMDGDVVVGI